MGAFKTHFHAPISHSLKILNHPFPLAFSLLGQWSLFLSPVIKDPENLFAPPHHDHLPERVHVRFVRKSVFTDFPVFNASGEEHAKISIGTNAGHLSFDLLE